MRASETAELIFDNCRIPEENLIGNEGDGFIQSLSLLDVAVFPSVLYLWVYQKVRMRLL